MLNNFQFQKATFYLQSRIYCTYLPELLPQPLFLICKVSSREMKFQPPWHLGLGPPWWQKMKKNRGKGISKSIESKLTTNKLLTVQLAFYRLQAIMTSVLKLWLLLPFFAPLDFSFHRSHSKGLGFYHHLVAFPSLSSWTEILIRNSSWAFYNIKGGKCTRHAHLLCLFSLLFLVHWQ